MSQETGKRLLVSKSNDLISGRYHLSAVALDLLNAMLARINPMSDARLPVFEFTESEMAEFMRQSHLSDASVYKYGLKIVEELLGLSVYFKTPLDNERQEINGINVFEKSSVIYNKRTNKLEYARFKFTEDIEPAIRELTSNFTRFHLSMVSRLESKHAKRIYEILFKEHAISRRYKNTKTTTVRFKLEDLKWQLGINSSYKKYSNFDARVLKVARKQISDLSNIRFDYRPLRESGKKYTHIEFSIVDNASCQKETGSMIHSMNLPSVSSEVERMINTSFPDFPATAFPILANYSKESVLEALLDFTRAKLTREITKPVDYFLGILKQKTAEQVKRQPASTLEKLTDRSWDIGFEIET